MRGSRTRSWSGIRRGPATSSTTWCGRRSRSPSWSARSCASTRPTRTCRTTSASTTASSRFVNNDHCLLSSRASLDLVPLMPPELAYLPGARRPSGTCRPASIRGTSSSARCPATTCGSTRSSSRASRPCPRCTGRTRTPLAIEGTWPERLNTWLTLVQRGEVINAYRVFLGLWEEAVDDRRSAPRCSPSSSSPASSTCRTACSTTAPTPPGTSPTAPAPRWSWRARSAGRTRTRSCTRACPTSRWGRAGTRPTRWAAWSSRTCSTIATASCSPTTRRSPRSSRWRCSRRS